MIRWLSALAVSILPAVPLSASAQDLIAEYFATIGPQDMRNSGGDRLGDWCAMIQQDRANFHRFGLRDPNDQSDPVFASREARAAMTGACRIMPGSEYIPGELERGVARYVWVRAYGDGDRPQFLVISEGAG
jgi:hypothetical protein